MHRRAFLKSLAASATASAFPQILRAETLGLGSATSPSNRLAVGLIGCGGQGRSDITPVLASPRARLVALCDPDDDMAARALATVKKTYGPASTCFTTRDFRELLARPGIDAVIIATPDHWHCLAAVAAARAGRHIYCEKPAATSIPEGRAMLDAITRAGVTCQIGSQQRSSAEFQRAIDLARAGFLGKITSVKVGLPRDTQQRPQSPPPPRPDPIPPSFDYNLWLGPGENLPYFKHRCHFHWRWSYALAGGQVTDWIGHHYDIAALALNITRRQPVAIRNATATFIDDSPLYNTARDYSFEAHYAGGAIIDVSSAHPDGLRLEGSEGWVHVRRGKIEHSREALRHLAIPAHARLFPNGPKGHIDQFIDAALTGAAPRCPIDEAHNIATVAHLANAAFRSGLPNLPWNPSTELPLNAPAATPFLSKTYRPPWTFPA